MEVPGEWIERQIVTELMQPGETKAYRVAWDRDLPQGYLWDAKWASSATDKPAAQPEIIGAIPGPGGLTVLCFACATFPPAKGELVCRAWAAKVHEPIPDPSERQKQPRTRSNARLRAKGQQ